MYCSSVERGAVVYLVTERAVPGKLVSRSDFVPIVNAEIEVLGDGDKFRVEEAKTAAGGLGGWHLSNR